MGSAEPSGRTRVTRGTSFRKALEQFAHARGYRLDRAQLAVCAPFERLESELSRTASRGFLKLFARPAPVRGIYLCGPVGRGKTFIMDAFFGHVSEASKRRVHFHRFMRQVHADLKDLQGQEEPLHLIAQRVAEDVRLLCLDEFHVTDIGDAMILSGLLAGLFEAGLAVVTTTNDAPEELYKHGLQRARFLPAIELIKSQLEFVPLVGPTDYRLRALQKVGVLHTPLNEASAREMLLAFEDIAGSDGETNVIVDVDGRDLLAKRVGDGTAWFTFAELCEKPRGTADYIELAQRYHTVLIEGVPVFHSNMKESMRRFNWLIDEFYDQRVKLVLSAQSGLERIFSDLMTLEGVARTQSRLIEMQTQAYLSQPHLA